MNNQHHKILKIAITGPESTGKTTLVRQLAEHYQTLWVPEYARFYLSRLNRPYTPQDVLEIAKGQLQWEDVWAQQANELLFCDTDLLVNKIWLKFKYNIENEWLESYLQSRIYDVHLLCNIDLPWSEDPLRENPDLTDRQVLYDLYKNELRRLHKNFLEIDGSMEERFLNAKLLIDNLLRREI